MTTPLTDVVKFHLSINVSDLKASLAFYEIMFGRAPAKVYDDYAKFELEEPPVVLSLIPSAPSPAGRLNHAGIRLASSEALFEMQSRMEHAGIRTQREDGVECCYAKQTKFWVTDPDRTLWELYILHEDIDDHGAGHVPHVEEALAARAPASLPTLQPAGPQNGADSSAAPAGKTWQHVLMVPLPARIDHADNSLDEVRLEGTLNARHAADDVAAFLQEVRRVLRPNGQVIVHGLVGNKAIPEGKLNLPGPASVVEVVPFEFTPGDLLYQAGFKEIRYTKLSEKPSFVEGSELRESYVTGRKLEEGAFVNSLYVLYTGPFAHVTDDEGHVFARGRRTMICSRTAAALLRSPAAAQFVFLSADVKGCCATP